MARALHKSLEQPRFALRRDEAAAAFSMSSTSFDKLVADGKMPKGHRIGAMVLWDIRQLQRAWQKMLDDSAESDDASPFDEIVA